MPVKAVLSKTDGYSISVRKFSSYGAAKETMKDEFDELFKEINDSSSSEAEMSSMCDDGAILYLNGENVYVWKITEI